MSKFSSRYRICNDFLIVTCLLIPMSFFVAVFSDLCGRMRIVSWKYFLTLSVMTCFMSDYFLSFVFIVAIIGSPKQTFLLQRPKNIVNILSGLVCFCSCILQSTSHNCKNLFSHYSRQESLA